MKLSDLLKYNEIIIQCHDNPDADTIASGYGVYTYLKEHNKDVRLVYSGMNEITKANLVLMVNSLNIPIEYVETLNKPELLVTVDCQYGEGNVTVFEADEIAIIDHHITVVELPPLSKMKSNVGSCATIVWDMLRKENYDVNSNLTLATALYYGLFTDTNGLTEISHPMDKDLRDEAIFDKKLITKFRNTNLSLNELAIAGRALINYSYNEEYHFAIVHAEPCDPNILGMISDLVLEVDVVDTCLVYSILPKGIKLSVRSCIREVKACELVQIITDNIGSGGGHIIKAGGFIKKSMVTPTPEALEALFCERMIDYFKNTEIIETSNYRVNTEGMATYVKNNIFLGYVHVSDMYPIGTEVNIRTLEGDLDVTVDEDTYMVIGINGEVYPIRKEKLNSSYITTEVDYIFTGEYEPTIKKSDSGNSLSIIPFAKSCIATGGVEIMAKQIDHRLKIFTEWDEEKYLLGRPGDYMVVRKDDLKDVYIIDKDIFHRTYTKVE